MRRVLSPSTSMLSSLPKRSKITTVDKIDIEDNVVTIPRSYQTELVEQAKHENLIVCLPTGSGKTYIAVMLIKEMAHEIRASIHDEGKRTVFLVKTVTLVQQQSDYIRIHTDLSVGRYYGELGVDLWQKEKWITEFEQHQVLVFTAQVFLNLVDHNYFPLHQVNLLIFDECHHSTGDNCYAALMNRHYTTCHNPPRILGLTASLSAKKITPSKLIQESKDIENTYKARVASASNREEAIRYGSSVKTEYIPFFPYKDEVCCMNESITIPFDTIKSILSDLESYLKEQKTQREKIEHDLGEIILTTDYLGENLSSYDACSQDYTIFLQSEYVSLPKLRRYIRNLLDTGYEFGIYGLFLAAKALQTVLKLSHGRDLIMDEKGKELFDSTSKKIDCVTDDILQNLIAINQNDEKCLFSSKVLLLLDRIKQDFNRDKHGRCIVFVQQIFTATILSQLLTVINEQMQRDNSYQFKIKYVTGPGFNIGGTAMTAKYQRQVIRDFRNGVINVLIATAVVEEGLDIPKCNLVFRFNKPPNFSSYMQSKGRARAKHNASYVILLDASNRKTYSTDLSAYENYEEIEKMLQEGFSIDNDANSTTDDLRQLEPYRTDNGVIISAIRAAQIIYEYCAIIGRGQLCPPRILYHKTDNGSFKSILSMPANCPIRDDIICENRRKKLAKFQCCLKMVELLHRQGVLNQDCLPYETHKLVLNDIPIEQRLFKLCDELFEQKDHKTKEIFLKQINLFPCEPVDSSFIWYLYRINIVTENNELGFIVPSKLDELPNFCLYDGLDQTLTVEIIYVNAIDYKMHKEKIDNFCKYLFEKVINGIINSSESILKFCIEDSPFKLLPCLLKNSNDIDYERMSAICKRLNKPVENLFELSDNELFIAWHLSYKPLYISIPSDCISSKRTSDLWPHKTESQTIHTYADYFESKVASIKINRNSLMATMKAINSPRINYLYEESKAKSKKNTNITMNSLPVYYPVELLHYAPVNQTDLKLFYKLPSILLRITELLWIERLRILFATNLKIYSFKDVKQMTEPVRFKDSLKYIEQVSMSTNPTTQPSVLPLTSLAYDLLSMKDMHSNEQPLPNILFQVVTRRSCGEPVDNENLEVLGDSFLKVIVSLSLYYRYPNANAGLLSEKRKGQISNENLYRLAVQKQLKNYLNVEKIVFRGKDANWLPPGYKVNEIQQSDGQQYRYQKAKRKGISDMIEAFIGAFLISSNYTTTIQFMDWLGLDVIPRTEQGNLIGVPSILRSNVSPNNHIKINEIVNKFFMDERFSNIEEKINYKFNNKAYLIAAFTHPSNYANRITDCYERLEFLGDALLDFLVTRYIFVHYNENVTPSRVTDIRQDLSNNGRLAYILVASGLHKNILHNSPALFSHISTYAGDEDLFPSGESTEEQLKKDLDQWADATAPKSFADVFEALIGAIFLDSGNSLQVVWKVIEPLLRHYIDRSIDDPNMNPVRAINDQGGKEIEEYVCMDDDRMISICRIQMPNGTVYQGEGTNKKIAKANACRKAIKSIHSLNAQY